MGGKKQVLRQVVEKGAYLGGTTFKLVKQIQEQRCGGHGMRVNQI